MSKRITQLLPPSVLPENDSAVLRKMTSRLEQKGIQIFYLDGKETCEK